MITIKIIAAIILIIRLIDKNQEIIDELLHDMKMWFSKITQ
jgi:hypothetical protein